MLHSDSGSDCSASDFADEPYTSPDEQSDNDNDRLDLNYSPFSQVANPDRTSDPQDLSEAKHWCKCEKCTDCSQKEAVCCQSKDELADLLDNELCITSTDLFNGLLSEGLEYSRFIHASAIRDTKKRQEYLSKEVTNGLKRHMLYRNFVLVMSRGYPLGKNNRVVLPRCVVEKIREKHPESEEDCYTGFIEAISEQENE